MVLVGIAEGTCNRPLYGGAFVAMDITSNQIVSSRWPGRGQTMSMMYYTKDGIKELLKSLLLDNDFVAPLATVEGPMRQTVLDHMSDAMADFSSLNAQLMTYMESTDKREQRKIEGGRRLCTDVLDTKKMFMPLVSDCVMMEEFARGLLSSQGHDTSYAVLRILPVLDSDIFTPLNASPSL